MTEAKRKLIDRLVSEDCGELFDQFVVVGLEYQLEVLLDGIDYLLAKDDLEDFQLEDLIEHHYDGMALIRVLQYNTANRDKYDAHSVTMWRAYTRVIGEVF